MRIFWLPTSRSDFFAISGSQNVERKGGWRDKAQFRRRASAVPNFKLKLGSTVARQKHDFDSDVVP